MEKPRKKAMILQHFSHEHLLEHRPLTIEEMCTCFGCKLEIPPGKLCYKCKICSFYLHQVCYNMPQKVQHPVDPNHHLTLLSLPQSNKHFMMISCEACQQSIAAGFYYNCATCAMFYHMLCLATPLSAKLPAHHHKLDLEFSPPYKFQCDLCNRPSHQGWLYRCSLCEFDVHISCAMMDSQDKLQSQMSRKMKRDGETKRHELMELLLQGVMDTHEHSQVAAFSDHNCATPSFQFSDACFSIDIERSFTGGDGIENKEAENSLVRIEESDQETKKTGYVLVNKGTFRDPKNAPNPIKSPSFESYVGGPQNQPVTHTKTASNVGLLQYQAKISSSVSVFIDHFHDLIHSFVERVRINLHFFLLIFAGLLVFMLVKASHIS